MALPGHLCLLVPGCCECRVLGKSEVSVRGVRQGTEGAGEALCTGLQGLGRKGLGSSPAVVAGRRLTALPTQSVPSPPVASPASSEARSAIYGPQKTELWGLGVHVVGGEIAQAGGSTESPGS